MTVPNQLYQRLKVVFSPETSYRFWYCPICLEHLRNLIYARCQTSMVTSMCPDQIFAFLRSMTSQMDYATNFSVECHWHFVACTHQSLEKCQITLFNLVFCLCASSWWEQLSVANSVAKSLRTLSLGDRKSGASLSRSPLTYGVDGIQWISFGRRSPSKLSH